MRGDMVHITCHLLKQTLKNPTHRGSVQNSLMIQCGVLKTPHLFFMQLPMQALRPESNHYATSAKKGVATGALLALDMAASPFGPSALAIISSATIRPDRVAPSMESK